MKKVLITGMAGLVGSVIQKYLTKDFLLSSLDLVDIPNIKSFKEDITNLDSIKHVFNNQDAVIHLAADPNGGATWDSILPNNIIGTYNVFEASRLAGIKRIILASSNHVVGFTPVKDKPYKSIYEERTTVNDSDIPYVGTNEIRPCCLYGVSKSFGESLASYYYDQFGISVISIRIGGVFENDEFGDKPSHKALRLSHKDLGQVMKKSIEAPLDIGHKIIYGISENDFRIHDIEPGKDIGYFSNDNAAGELKITDLDYQSYFKCNGPH